MEECCTDHRPGQFSGSTHASIETPPPSEENTTGQTRPSRTSSLPPPPPYNERELDFYEPGRLFKVWAPQEERIHKKQFLLIGTRNSHGPCLAVHIFTAEELQRKETSFHRTHALIQDFEAPIPKGSHHKRKTFWLDEYEEEKVPERCYVELDYNYDIAFSYASADCGMLYRPHLTEVRTWYRDWINQIWDLKT